MGVAEELYEDVTAVIANAKVCRALDAKQKEARLELL